MRGQDRTEIQPQRSLLGTWARAIKSKHLRNAATLLAGTAFAQAIPVCLSPVLTRVYLPAEFGRFVVFSGVSTLIAVGATGRYEHAILLPLSRYRAAKVALLTTTFSFIVAAITAIVLAVTYILNSRLFTPGIPWYLLPVTVGLFGPIQALCYFANRFGRFKVISKARVAQSTITVLTQIVFGWASPTGRTLIAATIIGQSSAAALLLRQLRCSWKFLGLRGLISEAKRFARFPLFSLPADVINTAANQLPLLVLMTKFGPLIAGYYGLTLRVLGMPLTLIANSVGDVFKSRAAAEIKATGHCQVAFRKTFVILLMFSLVPTAFFMVAAPLLFSKGFGEKWREAGNYAQILAVLYFFRFTASPLGYVMYITEKQAFDLIWQVGLFFVVLGSLMWPGANRPEVCLIRYTIGYSLMYVVYLGASYAFAKERRRM